ncbi:Rad21/Rec8-like protein, N-terminal [Kalmanozyma brasiliensis GHG001]|uniref:Rad21/Rec8-like protein N-terminal domain-containing protein n=2 Tax=Kalmanozyma brasiliensis TaxID=1392244 RepID=V5EGX8_KALBG|nr:Rad21/Rec8-like protein, N-terminal [Kalmanozyma brasiliensis GHG001]EST09811.1 Rad21/Rec8-like protein, N-terminal [Kalmanozyma brasiliensis GHG001]DBA11402.1 TPA_inf: REC8 [Kalmanozyma brasiliensis]
MFYSHDILSRRKTGLGIVWLAATLGDRSVVRRLSRRDILSVNVRKACEYVSHPTEPLALRLSSQLMYGVVKLYGHQTELLYQDVSNVHSEVRRHVLAGGSFDLETKNIDMRRPVRSVDAITLPLDLAFFTLDFDATSGLMYRVSVEPPERREMLEEALGDGFRTPTPVSFIAEEGRITLPGRAFEEDELGLPRGFGEGEEFYPMFGEGDYDEEEIEGLDLGLEGIERPEAFIPGAPEGIQRREVGDETAATIGPLVEWPELEERLAEEAARMEIGPIMEGVPTVVPARRPRDEEEETAEVEALLAPAVRRPRPPPRPFDDPETMLSDAEMRAARADYPFRMAAHRLAQQTRKQTRAADAAVRQAMFGPPEDLSLHPMLTEMWQMTVGEHLQSRRARLREMRAEAVLSPIDEAPPVPPPPTPMDLDEQEVGVARAAVEPEIPAALRGARESLPWNVFMEHRRRSSMMPSISHERETTPLRLREVSVETPTGLRRLPPLESPLFPPASPSTAVPFDDFYQPPLSLPGTPSVERIRLGLPTAPAAPAERSPTPPSQIFEEDMEEETRNFYEYARSIRQQLEDPNFLFFSDLAPVASSTPAVAAQAFYHTLALATRGRLKLKQDEPYQEIRITLVNP